jgi:hypothetical protein
MKSLFRLAGLSVFALFLGAALAADAPSKKAALQELNDFIGEWKGNGQPAKPRPAANELWSETVNWGWRFKGDDAWLTLDIKNGKHYKSGELRYLTDKKRYELTLTDKSDKKLVFEGEYKDEYLRLERVDQTTKDTQRLTMNLAGDGARFVYALDRKPSGRTLFVKEFQVGFTKEGESLGKSPKSDKPVCVVSGGLGTMTVSHKGEMFYVCCSGCRDAFNENPEKYIAEFKAKKGKK